MLYCAQNLFAFRPNQTCAQGEEVAPKSGLYIDDLEGISLAAMSQIGKHTYKTAQDALDSKTSVVIAQIGIDLEGELLRYGLVLPQGEPPMGYGNYADDLANTSLLGRGMVVQRKSGCSSLAALYVQSFQYKGAATETITVEIRNFQSGVLGAVLDTFSVSVVADVAKTVVVNEYYSVDIAIIATPSGAPYNTTFATHCIKGCYTANRITHRYDALQIAGYDGTTTDDANTYGITICATMRCYMPTFICTVLPNIYVPLWYRVAAHLLSELGALSAPTEYTAGFVNINPLRELKKEYEKKANDALRVIMQTLVENLRRTDKKCISCDNPNSIKIRSMV